MSKKGVLGRTPGIFESAVTITSAHFGSECVSVGENAFKNCVSMEEINGDNVVETIGTHAFEGTGLRSAIFNNLIFLQSNAFRSCYSLNYVSIPNCYHITSRAFANCTTLSSISIPVGSGVTKIDREAFMECYNLKNVDIDNVDTEIWNSAFYKCSNLKNIKFDNCIAIGPNAFAHCESLENVNLVKCQDVGGSAFNGCINITQVSVTSCKNIGSDAFLNCKNLKKVYINNPISIPCSLNSSYVFCTYDKSTSTYSINDTLFYFREDTIDRYKTFGHWKYYANNMVAMPRGNQIMYTTNDNKPINITGENESLIKEHSYDKYGLIVFADNENGEANITSLNQKIFKGSTTLTSIDLPANCEVIGNYEFEGCTALTNITPSPLNLLTYIGKYTFKDCENLTSFTIPNSVTDIGDGAFVGCSNLEKFEGNMARYGGKAVVSNNELKCVLPTDDSDTEGRICKISAIDSNIEYIGEYCFDRCKKLMRVNIPSTVRVISQYAFYGCDNLCEVHLECVEPPKIGEFTFGDISNKFNFRIFVPEESFTKYQEEWRNSDYASHIYPKPKDNEVIYYGNKLNTVSSNLINNNDHKNGTYYKISNISSTLPTNYFTGSSVTQVILGDGIKEISERAFKNCTNLEYIYLSDDVTKLNNECFAGCKSLKRIHIPGGKRRRSTVSTNGVNPVVTNYNVTFGNDIFVGCSNLQEFGTYYKGLVSDDKRCYILDYIGDDFTLFFFAQGNMSEEEKVYKIPEHVNKINKSAFRQSNIKEIVINSQTTSIGEYAFADCESLVKIKGWSNIESISKYAFANCRSLTGSDSNDSKIILPNKLTKLSEYVFNGCSSLRGIEINDNITILSDGSLSNCTSLINVGFFSRSASMLTSINANVFKGCTSLVSFAMPDRITYIGNSAFEGCSNYKGNNSIYYVGGGSSYNLTLSNNIQSIGKDCFKGTAITELNILKDSLLSKISNNAFYGCTSLKTINISEANNIVAIGDYAFCGCNNIESVTLPIPPIGSTLSLGNMCFSFDMKAKTENTVIYIPKALATPPTFTINGTKNTHSDPFGISNSGELKLDIIVPSSLYTNYVKDIFWGKYRDYITQYNQTVIKPDNKLDIDGDGEQTPTPDITI